MFLNDRQIRISTGTSRKAVTWAEQQLFWSEFVAGLAKPVRTTETFSEYKALPKAKQDELKDIGGFVGGTLIDGKRRNDNAGVRDLVTLDADSIEPGGTARILTALTSLGCAYAVYSTRKHEGAAPRLRIIFPLDRSCSSDEYEPIARKLASYIDMNIFDPTTFETVRLMYWPGCSSDSEFVFVYEDKPFVSADGILAMYHDWHSVSEWPEVPGAAKIRDRSAKKQGDPLEKKGVVGAFCRHYTIEQAMEAFIPGEYSPCNDPDRFTYTGGSTVGGAVVYDDKFIYSHHATDPCSGKLCNAFDMVRLHLFGEDDTDAMPDTPVTNLPSYKHMCEFAVEIPEIANEILQERYRQAAEAFSGDTGTDVIVPDDYSWMNKLKVNPQTCKPLSTILNVQLILENDAKLREHMYLDEFKNRVIVVSPLPWDVFEYPYQAREWTDSDDAGLRNYMEATYMITGKERILDGFTICMNTHRKNKLKDYFKSLKWDGTARVDRLLIDYFGAEDNAFSRESIRKCLMAAVARVLYPGCKFDNMLILSGRQGIGKSTFFSLLGKEWYSDSLSTFEGKDAAELLQGFWIVEAGELTGLNRSEMNDVKQFLSKREDIYREPYGRRTSSYPRRCIIVGTTNDKEFLKDVTGNRRFWPIDLEVQKPVKNIFKELPSEVDQIWAECLFYVSQGENLLLSEEALKLAEESQGRHREVNPKEGLILEFLDRPITEDWYRKDISERRDLMISDFKVPEGQEHYRDRVCVAEIYTECFKNFNIGMMKRQEATEINNILRGLPGWEPMKYPMKFGKGYGQQRGFLRVN